MQTTVACDAVTPAFHFAKLAGWPLPPMGMTASREGLWERSASVGAGIGWWDEVVEEVFLQGGDRGGGERLAAGGCGDNGEELEFGDGGAGDVDTLGIGAGVGRGELEAGVLDEIVSEGDVDGGEAFEEVRSMVGGAEGHAEPEAFAARLGEEGAAAEAFGIRGVVQVEVANVADVLDVVEKKRDDAAGEVQQVDGWLRGAVADEAGEGQVTGEGFASETTYYDLFVGGRHDVSVAGGLSHGG